MSSSPTPSLIMARTFPGVAVPTTVAPELALNVPLPWIDNEYGVLRLLPAASPIHTACMVSSFEIELILIQAPRVKFTGVKNAAPVAVMALPSPPLWNPWPTSPVTNEPPDPTSVPGLPPRLSSAFPLSGHQLRSGPGVGAHGGGAAAVMLNGFEVAVAFPA